MSGAVGEGEVVGEGLPNPKPVCPNTFVLAFVKEPNAPPDGLLNALGVEDDPNALFVPDPNAPPVPDEPNALEAEGAPPNALGAEANALNPDAEVDVGCAKGVGWDGWLNGVPNADGEDVCPKVEVCPNPVVPKPLPLPLPNAGWPNVEVDTGWAKAGAVEGANDEAT
jgi:hypothetical protein